MMAHMDIHNVHSIHFVGMKGVAMTALAIYAKERGIHVTGCDLKEKFPTDDVLQAAGINCLLGFSSKHIIQTPAPDLVIYTGAHEGQRNREVQEAISRGIPVLPHGKALGEFMKGSRQISIAGSHGKTTTTAMIATILSHAKLDPSYTVGCGEVFGLGASGHYGTGDFFISEADEYATDPTHDATPRFLWQSPEILVVTNIDFDHPDIYPSLRSVTAAFVKFCQTVPRNGMIIMCSDDGNSQRLGKFGSLITRVGRSEDSDYQVRDIRDNGSSLRFELVHRHKLIHEFEISLLGFHNAVSAAMAAVVAHRIGVSWPEIHKSLCTFRGTKRRWELLERLNGVTFYDDYAHHPREIAATLSGVRARYRDNRIITIFQPHTYSRTKALLTDFAKAFHDSDMVLITEIYASAREHDVHGISGKLLAKNISHYHADTIFCKDKNAVAMILRKHIKPGDTVIFMGAGDIYTWEREIIKELKTRATTI